MSMNIKIRFECPSCQGSKTVKNGSKTYKKDNMKSVIFFLATVLLLVSCQESKKYEYIEVGTKSSVFGGMERIEKDIEVIKAKTDSVAYLEAYQSFCISEKVSKHMQKTYGTSVATPTSFKLLNESGNDIAPLANFQNIDSLKADIRSRIFKITSSMQGSGDFKEQERVEVDSAKIKELKPFFNLKEDEFDPKGLVWYKPKSVPKYTNRNAIYCYFQSNNKEPSNLRLRLQYHANDWLFFKKVQFSIDGKAYEFIPMDTETDSGNGGRVWEWFDEPMRRSNTELLEALANAKSAKMKLIGNQYYDIKKINSTQIRDIKRTLSLYKAMGGAY